MNKKHSKSTFKDEWLLNPKYKPWLNNISSNTVRCSFCNKHIDVLSMGVSALESHSNGEKQTNTSWSIEKLHYFFSKSSASSTDAEKSVENSSSENTCKNISFLDNIVAVNENSLNAEIIWCLKVVNAA